MCLKALDAEKLSLRRADFGGATETRDRFTADLYVVDVNQIGTRDKWWAMMAGRVLCDSTYVTSHGSRGRSIAYDAPIGSTSFYLKTCT